ncbi:type III secretion protein HrpV [Pseudomonas sp. PA15(2017)]|uniref:type III secretion protein HrpV n=1 Tax=Pseudomonas sp. PA15(2017) TaxID=1932111 RepID=UPI000964366E|nr:type III secretion protein HrpV [Pseudomonas sp. PA15(2017)]OLU33678.1 type III secretion protein HrpV [Pseudomonas sp. PA15(2017)]
MMQTSEKRTFLEHAAAERGAVWPLASGVAFISRRDHRCWGVALHVEVEALGPDQLRATLARRFCEADRYDQFFLFLNLQRELVVWHAAPVEDTDIVSLDHICQEQLALVGLEHLP